MIVKTQKKSGNTQQVPTTDQTTVTHQTSHHSRATNALQPDIQNSNTNIYKSFGDRSYHSYENETTDLSFTDEYAELILGNIWHNVTFIFPNKCHKLETLVVGYLHQGAIFNLTSAFANIVNLAFGGMNKNSLIKVSTSLNKLEKLDIGDLSENAVFILPDQLPRLKRLSIGTLELNTLLKLPISLPCLESFSISNFRFDVLHIDSRLPTDLYNVKSFAWGEISYNFTLPNSLINLIDLSVGNLLDGTLTLPDTIVNIQNIEMQKVQGDSKLNLPEEVTCLKSFSVESFESTTFTLPSSLNKIEKLFINYITQDSNILNVFSRFLQNLKELKIAHIAFFCKFPIALDKLINLEIGVMHAAKNFELPKSLKKLKTLMLKLSYSSESLKLPNTLPMLETLSIKNIHDSSTIIFPKSCNSLKNLNIKNISDTKFIFPDLFPHLILFTIHSINENANFNLPNSPELKTISIKKIANNAKLCFPKFLNNLETLIIEKIEENVVFDFPKALPKLNNLFINGHNAQLVILENNVKKFIITSDCDAVTENIIRLINAVLSESPQEICSCQ